VLTWSRRARLRAEVTRRLWPIPLGFAVAAVGLAALVSWIERTFTLASPVTFSASAAQPTLSSIASGMLVFIGFVFSVVTFAIQYEASTYTPRLLRSVANSTAMRVTLGVFIATFVYAVLVLTRVEPEREYGYSVGLAPVLVGVSILFFLVLMTEVADRARSGRTVGEVARSGRRTIERMRAGTSPTPSPADDDVRPAGEGRVVPSAFSRGGVVQAIDVKGLVDAAARHDAVVEFVPGVGGFVAAGAPLFRVYGGTTPVPDQTLHSSVLLGEERTADQDPRLSIRILVDIAIRALSPAVNDPSTAVEALSRIGDLLNVLASRTLPDGVHRDLAGSVRLLEPVPSWDEYLELAFTEIRVYGAGSPFVVRETRRVLDELRELAPADRRPAVEHQSSLFDLHPSAGP
jgi:uncharacterized membrane protein